jgi:hypothetical protein
VIAAGRFVRDFPGELDPHSRLVAFALASFADREGLASPSLSQLEAVTGLSRHTVIDRIRRLEAAGAVQVTRLDRRQSRYRFPVRTTIELSTSGAPGAPERASTGAASYPHLVQTGCQTGAPALHPLEVPTWKTARANAGLWIQGTGWVQPPKLMEA